MKTPALLALNVRELLARNHQNQTDLAQWCRRTDTWVSQFLNGQRGWRLADLDRIADLWGLQAYQLFIPGISARTERRSGGDRRTVQDRRIGHAERAIFRAAQELDRIHPRRRTEPHVVATSPLAEALAKIADDTNKRIAAAIRQHANAGDEAPAPRKKIATRRARRGNARGQDAAKD